MEDNLKNLKKNIKKGVLAGLTAAGSVLPHEKAEAQMFHKDYDKGPKTEQTQEVQKSSFDLKLEEMQKKYTTDNTYYRAVSVGENAEQNLSITGSIALAQADIAEQAGFPSARFFNTHVVEQYKYKDPTGVYHTVTAIEVLKPDVEEVSRSNIKEN